MLHQKCDLQTGWASDVVPSCVSLGAKRDAAVEAMACRPKYKTLSEEAAAIMAYHVLQGLQVLHNQRLIHRDIAQTIPYGLHASMCALCCVGE